MALTNYNEANMKDDTATLSSLGVHKGSVITLNGNKVDVSKREREKVQHIECYFDHPLLGICC